MIARAARSAFALLLGFSHNAIFVIHWPRMTRICAPGRLGLLTASDKEGAGRHVEEDQADRVGLDTQLGGWFCPRPLRKISPPPPIEQVATAEQRFDQLDADLNGLISPEEFRHAVSKAKDTEELFRAADANRTIRSAERSGRIGGSRSLRTPTTANLRSKSLSPRYG
jgi:hypothetical protein